MIVSEVEAAEAELQRIKGIEGGRVVVGTMHTMGPVDVSLVLAIFHKRHPAVELTVREQSSEELAQMLRDDELDLAFLSVTERVESHGKHLLLHLDGGLALHSHLGMHGGWHLYREGQPWRRPPTSAWIVLTANGTEAVNFGGSTLWPVVSTMMENLWAELAQP